MWAKIKDEWNMMYEAGTIMWARIKLLAGLAWTGITQSGIDLGTIITNPKALLATKVVGYLLLIDGGVSEYIRRHNASDLKS